MDDSSRDSNDNSGVDTNDEDDADFSDGKIKVDCGDDSDGGGSSDTIDDGGVNDDSVVDTNISNNPDCADSKSKVAISEGTLGDDDDDDEVFCRMVDQEKAISLISS